MRTTLEILRMTSGGADPQAKLVGIMDTQIDELTAQLDLLLRSPGEIVRISPTSPGGDES